MPPGWIGEILSSKDERRRRSDQRQDFQEAWQIVDDERAGNVVSLPAGSKPLQRAGDYPEDNRKAVTRLWSCWPRYAPHIEEHHGARASTQAPAAPGSKG